MFFFSLCCVCGLYGVFVVCYVFGCGLFEWCAVVVYSVSCLCPMCVLCSVSGCGICVECVLYVGSLLCIWCEFVMLVCVE